MRRVFSTDGSGSSQSIGVFMSPMSSGSFVAVVERRAIVGVVDIWGCDPVSAVSRTRSGALWRAALPFADFRLVACIS